MTRRSTYGPLAVAARRTAALALAFVALATLPGCGAGAGSSYRIDAIFDDARGLVPGQLVEVAGARVGTIENVALTADHKARVEMRVDRRFAPFRIDANCAIKPQGLIAENYVDCDPGSPAGAQLQASASQPPTVPVTQTTEPVSLTDLFNIWNAPTRQRLGLLVAELGLGSAARGGDINALLRRANPALALARQAIALLQRQRAQLAQIVDGSSRVIAAAAPRSGQVHRFITSAAAVTERTAAERVDLGDAVRRLPRLLDTARPALRQLDAVATAGTPLLHELQASAPELNRVATDIEPFARAARPALARLGSALDQGIRTSRDAAPISGLLRSYAAESLPDAQLAGQLFTNLRDAGFGENFLSFFYYAAAASARFDSVSHILPSRISLSPCSAYASTPVAGCSANYTTVATARRRGRAKPGRGAPPTALPLAPTQRPGSAPPPVKLPAMPRLPTLPTVPQIIQQVMPKPPTGAGSSPLGTLLKYLLQ